MNAASHLVIPAAILPADGFAVIALAATWVLVALGLHLTFGMLGIVNLAHGEMLLVGGYVALLIRISGLPMMFAIIAGAGVAALLGAAMDLAILRRLRERPLDTLLATFGVAVVLRQSVQLLVGPNPQTLVDPIGRSLELSGMVIPAWRGVIVLLTALLVLSLHVVLSRTALGVTWRATAADPRLASSFGLRAPRIRTTIVAVGSGIAGLAGAVLAPLTTLTPQFGTRFLVPAFLVVILGGTGSLAGLAAAGVVLGGSLAAAQFVIDAVAAEIVVILLAVVLLRLRAIREPRPTRP
jgi:branched-subunit amino acid ABC-type transport system permease component